MKQANIRNSFIKLYDIPLSLHLYHHFVPLFISSGGNRGEEIEQTYIATEGTQNL